MSFRIKAGGQRFPFTRGVNFADASGDYDEDTDELVIRTGTYAERVALYATDYGMGTGATAAANRTGLIAFGNAIKSAIDGGAFVEAIFEPGDYPISAGVIWGLSQGSGGLHVTGYGARLVFATTPVGDNYTPALRIAPASVPANESQYIKDIYVEGLGILDTDAEAHRGATEETHGLNIRYGKNVRIWMCKVEGMGDEPIELDYCIDFAVFGNHLLNCQAATSPTPDGACISIKNGCKRGKVFSNTIDTTVQPDTKGIQVKVIDAAVVEDVEIYSNVITNINGWGLFVNAGGAGVRGVRFHHNTVLNVITGIGNTGSQTVVDCEWTDNTVRNASAWGVQLTMTVAGSNGNRCDANYVANCNAGFLFGTVTGAWRSVRNNDVANVQQRAFYLDGIGLRVEGGTVTNANLAGTANQSAVFGNSAGQMVERMRLIAPGARGFQNVDYVRGCHVTGVTGDGAAIGATEISGGYFEGRVNPKTGGAVLNSTINTTANTTVHAVDIGALTDVRVIGNHIRADTGSGRLAIREATGSDHNIITNNNVRGESVTVVGAGTINANNRT